MKFLVKRYMQYFVDVFNKLLKHIVFPSSWKDGNLILFQKPGKKLTSAAALRPIVLLPAIGKIFETLLINRIQERLRLNHYYSDAQHGFTKNKNTTSATNQLIDHMKNAKRQLYGILISIDFTSAFDTLEWNKIIKNITNARLDESELAAAKELLMNRTVTYDDGCRRIRRNTETGCPQGSCASPELWLAGVNDLLKLLSMQANTEVIAFADDVCIVLIERNKKRFKKLINCTFEIINEWCAGSGVQLNLEKTTAVLLGRREFNATIKFRGKIVRYDDRVKYLGMILQSDLKYSAHIDYIEQKSSKLVKLIHYANHLAGGLTIEQKTVIYRQVYLVSVLYGSEVWHPRLNSMQRAKLTSIQRQAILAISGAYFSTNNKKLLNLLNFLDVNDEIACQLECRGKDLDEKSAIRLSWLEKQKEKTDGEYTVPPTIEVKEFRRKEPMWFITAHGPFRHHRARFNPNNASLCRFCVRRLETAGHLLSDCTDLGKAEFSDTRSFELICISIIQRLFKL